MNHAEIAKLSQETREKLVRELTNLVALETEIQKLTSRYTSLTRDEETGLRDRIKEWLKRGLEIANEFKPREFTISAEIGFPPRIGTSFTWSMPKD